jgi:hypothetical protein
VIAHPLDLLQCRRIVFVFVEDLHRRQVWNDIMNKAIDVCKQFGKRLSTYKLGKGHEAIDLKVSQQVGMAD